MKNGEMSAEENFNLSGCYGFLLYNNYIYKKKGENKLMVQIKIFAKEFKTGNLVQKHLTM